MGKNVLRDQQNFKAFVLFGNLKVLFIFMLIASVFIAFYEINLRFLICHLY